MRYLKHSTLVIVSTCCLFLATGCASRTSASAKDNTKTAFRHFSRGMKSLIGGAQDSRLIHSSYEFVGPEDTAYIALYDDSNDGGTVFPLSTEVPGELGSFLPTIDGFHNPEGKELAVFKNIHFDTDQDRIKGAEDEQTLTAIAKFLKKNPDYYVYVAGHCDARGTALYNMSLGSRRGLRVRNLLIEKGVDLNRLFTVSYGKEKPLDEGNNPLAWEKNRRVEFKLFKKN